jgi:hypothetical protein
VNPPTWLKEALATIGARHLHGQMTRAEADSAIIAVTREHPEYGASIGEASALSALGKYVRKNTSSGDLFQAQMFQGLPASMLIAPKREVPVRDMTAADLDHAKNMLYARTANQVRGTREAVMAERAAFDEFYGRVRPLLDGDLTVADVLGKAALAVLPEPGPDGKPDWLVIALARLEPEAVAEEIARHPEYLHGLLTDIASGLHDGLTLADAIAAAAEKAA